jgi:hypothetical protein
MPAERTHNLNQSALEMLDGAITDAVQLGGMILQARMQEKAPLLTGRMERSVGISAPEKTPDGIRVLVGPTVDYAKYTELEPYIIGKRPGPKSQMKGATIPWMRPAVDETRDEITRFIQTAVERTVQGLARRFHP